MSKVENDNKTDADIEKSTMEEEKESVPKLEADSSQEANTEASVDADIDIYEESAHNSKVSAHKSTRKRKRHYYNAIRTQMEFYFGDANLSKDRFLMQMINKDPYVPLDVFLTFNKMKTLAKNVEEIVISLSNSTLLELDETKQKVRRKIALPEERNVDEKTLYVEALPITADHDWVRKMFERFGPIVYVSLPKYAKSRKIKQFGFVEFEKEKSVQKAIKAFEEFNGVICAQQADPAELISVKSYIKEQNNEEEPKDDAAEVKKTEKAAKEQNDDEEAPKVKKRKIETETEDDDANSTTTAGEDENTTASDTAAEQPASENDKPNGDAVSATKKKQRKKKKKAKSIEKQNKQAMEFNADANYYELKVLPKRDWKRLRNKYLNLQREQISELKRKAFQQQQLAKKKAKQGTKRKSEEPLDGTADTPAKKSKSSERKLQRMNMNFYGAGEDEPPKDELKVSIKEAKQNPALERAPLFSYEPGIIVEISFLEPCVNVKEFKTEMRQHAVVKYVDIKEGAMHAYLRLESSTAAQDFARDTNCAEYKCKVLTGDADTEYWKKIEKDREMKLNKQVKVTQKRGRERVKKLEAKHTHFNDDEE